MLENPASEYPHSELYSFEKWLKFKKCLDLFLFQPDKLNVFRQSLWKYKNQTKKNYDLIKSRPFKTKLPEISSLQINLRDIHLSVPIKEWRSEIGYQGDCISVDLEVCYGHKINTISFFCPLNNWQPIMLLNFVDDGKYNDPNQDFSNSGLGSHFMGLLKKLEKPIILSPRENMKLINFYKKEGFQYVHNFVSIYKDSVMRYMLWQPPES